MPDDTLSPCDRGWHGKTIYGPPQDLGEAVNREGRCPICGRLVTVESWTKADYVLKFGPVAIEESHD